MLFYQPSPTYSVPISTPHQLAEPVYYSNSILRYWQKSPKPGFSPPGRDTSSSSAKDDSSPCHRCYVAIQCQMYNLRGPYILMGGYTHSGQAYFPNPETQPPESIATLSYLHLGLACSVIQNALQPEAFRSSVAS